MNKNITILNRLKKIIPNHIKPKFYNDYELLKWHEQQSKLLSRIIKKNNQIIKHQSIIEKSGIQKLYTNCSFKNYYIEHEGHRKVLESAKKYAKEFDKHEDSFIFSGKPGTGKNHLACAISNYLISYGKNVLILTISDLMSNLKDTFNNHQYHLTEKKILNKLNQMDLLILDEIGIQIASRYEKNIINQIIDRRAASKKSTGMISNLDYNQMEKLLGERVMDRMCIGNSLWLNFGWKSYRRKIK
ncbi:ATP-binding protein [Buchnera aphidicola]|uniref:ATP-binding protein n=1 Tax=Buchnera aphidicola TaxID=9 RepID=UPI003464E577